MGLLCAVIFSASLLKIYAQDKDITVLHNSTNFEQTKIVFTTYKNKKIDLFTVESYTNTAMFSFGWKGQKFINFGNTVNSITTKYLLTIPGEIVVDKNVYTFYAGNSNQYCTFNIVPDGGTQYWEIKKQNTPGYITGLCIGAIGSVAAILGFSSLAQNKSINPWNISFASIGTVCSGLGFVVFYNSRAWAKLINVEK